MTAINGVGLDLSSLQPYMTSKGIDLTKVRADQQNLDQGIFSFITSIKDTNNNGVIEVSEINGNQAIDQTVKTSLVNTINSNQTTATDTEAISETRTAAFRAQLKSVQEINKIIVADKEKLEAEIESIQEEIDNEQTALISKLEEAEYAGQKLQSDVKTRMGKAVQNAREKSADPNNGDFATLLHSEMSGLGIDEGSITSVLADATGFGAEIKRLSGKISNLNDLISIKNGTLESFGAKYGELLNVNPDLVSVTNSGQIIVGTVGAEGPERTGAEGVSAADMARFSGMSESQLTQELTQNHSDLLAAAGGNAANVAKTIISLNNAMEAQDAEAGKYGAFNVKEKVLNGVGIVDLKTEVEESFPPPPVNRDPYEVEIDGKKYILVKDDGDGKLDDNADLLGFNTDKANDKSTWGAGIKGIGNGDQTLTREEMQEAGVKLVEVGADGKLKADSQFDLNKINSITLNSSDKLKSSNDALGSKNVAGTLSVSLADGRNVTGEHTFREASFFNNLFSKDSSQSTIGTFLSKVMSETFNIIKGSGNSSEIYEQQISDTLSYVQDVIDNAKNELKEENNSSYSKKGGKEENEKPAKNPFQKSLLIVA